ncbi:MAG: isoprenylcysteine carboxylmethyltransferase family protein [Candidatus Paceibacterota bacterium]
MFPEADLAVNATWTLYLLAFLIISAKKGHFQKTDTDYSSNPKSKKPLILFFSLHFLVYPLLSAGVGSLREFYFFNEFYFSFFIAGIVFLTIGLIFSIISRYYLSSRWSFLAVASNKRPFIKDGPYKIVRHPICLGLFIIWLGASFVYVNWLGIAAAIFALLPLLYWRVKIEEKKLTEIFSEDYLNYSQNTGMIFPKILN